MGSELKIHSMGIVVEDKPEGTDYILVSPIEELNLQESGLIREKSKDFVGNKRSLSSVNFESEHESKNFVRAKWTDVSGGNRTTAPDVAAGETVLLFKFANVDEYFWCDFGREPELRRQEDVLYSFSNQPNKGPEYNKESSYWIHISTKHKFFHIHTANNDGELTTYDIRADTKAGLLEIKDGLGNCIEMNSATGTIRETAVNEIIRTAPRIHDISTYYTNTTTHYNQIAEYSYRDISREIKDSSPLMQELSQTHNLSTTSLNEESSVTIRKASGSITEEAPLISEKSNTSILETKDNDIKAETMLINTNLLDTTATTIRETYEDKQTKGSTLDTTATTIRETYEDKQTKGSTLENRLSRTIVNDVPNIRNTGNMVTDGSHLAHPNLNPDCN